MNFTTKMETSFSQSRRNSALSARLVHRHYEHLFVVFVVISLVSFHISPAASLPTSNSNQIQRRFELYRQRNSQNPSQNQNDYPDWDYLSENQNQNPSEAVSSSLSIVSPLEVLRQTLAAEIKRNRIRQAKDRRVAANSEYIRRIGR